MTEAPTARRSPFIGLVTLDGLLALTTSAHAECALVLWYQPPGGPWEPKTAASSDRECAAERDRAVKRLADIPSAHLCLSDIVDPRGPKGE